jgi:pimeloyl-ACP methyl ester carboxylesterase
MHSPTKIHRKALAMTQQLPTILLVHGAWHGAWCWDRVTDLLVARGRAVRSLDLPTVHAPDKESLGLADDAAAVAAAIEGIDGPVVVVAHSYGGVPVTQGATDARVVHIVYVAAFVLDEGESLLGAVGGVAPDWWRIDGGLVTAGYAEEPAQRLFFGDVSPAAADEAASRLVAQSRRPFEEAVSTVAWRDRPTTYILTEQDAVFPVPAQEMLAARSGSAVHRLDTSHSPFMSQPEAVADIVASAGV